MPPLNHLSLILAVSLPMASVPHPQDVDVDRATQLTRMTRQLVVGAEAFQATTLAQSALRPAGDPGSRAYPLFTGDWLERKVAQGASADRALPPYPSSGLIEQDPTPPPSSLYDGLLMRIFDPDGRGGLFSPSPLNSWGDSTAYLGYALGGSGTDQTARDVQDTLTGLSWDITATLDGSTDGTRLYLGYRLAGPFALEVGYTDLGTIESVIGPDPANPVELAQFLDDISRTHPAKGSGLTVAGRALLWGADDLNLSAKCGLWMWSANVNVLTSTASVKIDRDGADMFYGFDLTWYPVEWGAIRLDYERYTCDDTDADLFSVGLEIGLDRLLDRIRLRR